MNLSVESRNEATTTKNEKQNQKFQSIYFVVNNQTNTFSPSRNQNNKDVLTQKHFTKVVYIWVLDVDRHWPNICMWQNVPFIKQTKYDVGVYGLASIDLYMYMYMYILPYILLACIEQIQKKKKGRSIRWCMPFPWLLSCVLSAQSSLGDPLRILRWSKWKWKCVHCTLYTLHTNIQIPFAVCRQSKENAPIVFILLLMSKSKWILNTERGTTHYDLFILVGRFSYALFFFALKQNSAQWIERMELSKLTQTTSTSTVYVLNYIWI